MPAALSPFLLQFLQRLHGLQACRCRRPAQPEDIGNDICRNILPGLMSPWNSRKHKIDKRLDLFCSLAYDSALLCNFHQSYPERHYARHGNAERHCLLCWIQSSSRYFRQPSLPCTVYHPNQQHPSPQIIQHSIHHSSFLVL